jgi:hypothetical protein
MQSSCWSLSGVTVVLGFAFAAPRDAGDRRRHGELRRRERRGVGRDRAGVPCEQISAALGGANVVRVTLVTKQASATSVRAARACRMAERSFR